MQMYFSEICYIFPGVDFTTWWDLKVRYEEVDGGDYHLSAHQAMATIGRSRKGPGAAHFT